MKQHKASRPHGQLRMSQLITSFGPGAMVDLPEHSVLIGGLDSWTGVRDEILEPRLVEKLKGLFEPPLTSLQLFSPPPDPDDPMAPKAGVRAWQFPEWFITQDVDTEHSDGLTRSRALVHRNMLTKGKYIDDNKKKRVVVPIRFVRACRAGHIADIDWREFAHNGPTDCRRTMRIEERGTSGDLADVWIRCECGRGERSIAQAAETNLRALGMCNGARPWLGGFANQKCGEPNRLLIRNASNAYFPQIMSAISLPERDDRLREAVDAVWDFIGEVENIEQLQYERKKQKVRDVLEGYSDEEVFEMIKVRRGQVGTTTKSIKQAEMETLIACTDEIGKDAENATFYATAAPRTLWDEPWMAPVERVVLVHRLREVVAQVGFTRFESVSPDIDGELEMGVRRAELAREVSWLPAIENRGEGIFLQFRTEAVQEWLGREPVVRRGEQLLGGYEGWKADHNGAARRFVELGGLLPYVLFHSLSHLLITSVSLECGYPASSIRERIYSLPDVGYGILLYTGSSDAEGTLGGLVGVGRHIAQHVRNALRLGELCSNDPVCAQHEPGNQHERRFLHGAACHGCLLISETSCEQHNEFLDRALVNSTVDDLRAEFFKGYA